MKIHAKTTRAHALWLVGLASLAPAVEAADIDVGNLANLQPQFNALSKDLTSILSYKAIAPAEPLGITGFDVGLELSATRVKSSNVWQLATGSDINVLPVPRLHVVKGLPFGIDIGATYTQVPDSNIKFWGAEVKYALLDGGVATPAIAIRGAYTKLNGVSQLDFNTRSVDLSISKGLLNFTPYAGIGKVWSTADTDVVGLTKVDHNENKLFAGFNFNVLLGNVAVEWDRTGDNDTLSAKLGLRF